MNSVNTRRTFRLGLAIVTCCALSYASLGVAQTALEGKNLSALARENLDKKRPKPPFDLTGTYNFDWKVNGGPFTAYKFLPVPQLLPSAQKEFDTHEADQKKGLEYKDDPAACWPLGMPRMMTRYWPIQIIQLPTEVVLITMFDHSVRWIYTDGRPHPSDNDLVYTYNGHSIGHWEGNALIVDTVGLTDDHHWLQEGVPVGTNLHVVERITKIADGFQDEFTITDPDNWVGELKSTKRYTRDDKADIEEHVCIYEEVSQLPGFKFNVRE